MKKSLLGFALGLLVALLLTGLAGENPAQIFWILCKSAMGSNYDFGLTLFYACPLIFCGLSVAWAYRTGLFNIGAEGQLIMGSLALAAVGLLPLTSYGFVLVLTLAVPLIAAGFWGYFAGWMRSRLGAFTGAHEVIVTMMLNFIAAGFANYVVLNLIPSSQSQNPESEPIQNLFLWKESDPIKSLFPDSPVSFAIVLAVVAAVTSWFIFEKTRWGYEMKMVGLNPVAAEKSGISVRFWQKLSMTVAGAFAGAVAWSEIVGSAGQFKIGFSPDYGFLGIAVALMAGGRPLGILVAGFLMAALHKGATDLDIETATITRDFSKVLQGLIILFVAAPGFFPFWKQKIKKQWKDKFWSAKLKKKGGALQ